MAHCFSLIFLKQSFYIRFLGIIVSVSSASLLTGCSKASKYEAQLSWQCWLMLFLVAGMTIIFVASVQCILLRSRFNTLPGSLTSVSHQAQGSQRSTRSSGPVTKVKFNNIHTNDAIGQSAISLPAPATGSLQTRDLNHGPAPLYGGFVTSGTAPSIGHFIYAGEGNTLRKMGLAGSIPYCKQGRASI